MPVPHSNDANNPHAYNPHANNPHANNPHANNPHAYNPHSHNPHSEEPEPAVPLTATGLTAFHESGLALQRAKEYFKAAKVFNRGIHLSEEAMKEPRMKDPNHAAEARTILELLTSFLSDFGQMLVHLKEYGQASKVFFRTLEVTRDVFDTSHPTYGLTLRNLGETHMSLQDYDEALRQFKSLEKLLREYVDIHDPSVGRLVTQIGLVYMAQGRMATATSHFEAYLAQVGGDSHDVALSMAYSKALAQDGQRDKGLEWAQASVAKAESALARVSDDEEEEKKNEAVVELALCLNNLAGVTALFKRLHEARGYLERAKDLVDASLGSEHPLSQSGQQSIDQLSARIRPPHVVSNTEL